METSKKKDDLKEDYLKNEDNLIILKHEDDLKNKDYLKN